jgi:hypothetical protein
MVTAGIGNNYRGHNPNQNDSLRALVTSSGYVSVDVYNSLRAMPELCLNCHYRVIGVDNNHGGFAGGGFGICDKCHSMHGQHSEPATQGSEVNSTNIVRPLHYGMYRAFDVLPIRGADGKYPDYETGWAAGGYETFVYEWDTSGLIEIAVSKKVIKDVTGQMFSFKQNDNLIHMNFQEHLCKRCHGNSKWWQIVDSTDSANSAPPQIFYEAGRKDSYFTASVTSPINRNISTHPVDIPYKEIPGGSIASGIELRCSSGTKDPGCHSAHGNNNYAQLNVMCNETTQSLWGNAEVNPPTGGTKAEYRNGMHEFCSLCHSRFGSEFTNPANLDVYTRHPVGPGVSMLNLFESSDRSLVKQNFFDSLIFDYDTNAGTGYPAGRPTYNDFLNADTAKAAKNFVITCTTCHHQHGSDNKHLRKFSDKAVSECVNCHSKSPDLLK